MKISVDMSKIERYAELIAQFPEVLGAHLETASVRSTAFLEAQVKHFISTPFGAKPPAIAYGFLVNSVYGEPREAPPYGGIVAVHPPADVYAAAVEYGTRPHFPPIAALVPWVKRKFQVKDEAEAESIAFLIARKIAARGTQGHHMFERALASAQGPVIAEYEAAVADAAAEIETGEA